MMYSFTYLEPVCCSMSSFKCCFLTCIQISQEAGQVVWYSHFFQNFPQFVLIHTVKGFGIVNKPDVFLELSCFFNDSTDIGNLISGSSAFSKTSLNIWTQSLIQVPSGSSWMIRQVLMNESCQFPAVSAMILSYPGPHPWHLLPKLLLPRKGLAGAWPLPLLQGQSTLRILSSEAANC